MAKQFQFEITDADMVDAPPMAFPNEEARQAMLDYVLEKNGVGLDDIAQIVFTRMEDDGKMVIELALQKGKDVTRYARFA